MKDIRAINFDKFTFDGWVDFIFNHRPKANKKAKEWYWKLDVWFEFEDGKKQIRYLTRLFENPEIFLKKFSVKQIEQGFWFLYSCSFLISKILVDKKVGWRLKGKLLHSVEHLYQTLFKSWEPETAAFMFWDSVLAGCFDYPAPEKPLKKYQIRLQDLLFISICNILHFPFVESQKAALHGLRHLQHPKGNAVMRNFVMKCRNQKLKKYAQDCLAKTVQ